MLTKPTFEFHVSRAARDKYQFDQALFSLTGRVLFANPAASREFAYRMNLVREAEKYPDRTVHQAAIYAMGLIDEALHAIITAYREHKDPRVMEEALSWYEARLGKKPLDRTLLSFVDQFPPLQVYRGKQTASQWLVAETGGVPHRAVALEEMILLWLENLNPAFQPYRELFNDGNLSLSTHYPEITSSLHRYFQDRPGFGTEGENLVDILLAPALLFPDSLEGQLAFIKERYGAVLEVFGFFSSRMIVALDVLKEESVAVWLRYNPPAPPQGGAPPLGDSSAQAVPSFTEQVHEYEAFSPDLNWMPRTVLIAKTVFVWLDQLSRKYARHIGRLDQIPDQELDLLAQRGFNALWLIGVWERSRASKRVKQLCGNPEAVASAYSLYDYAIAEDLGGDAAFADLRNRARARGIRLASDMVPNHMSIDSRWMLEHPDWFLSLPNSPFPAYRFEGPDLSGDSQVEIKIEDHYYNRTDAAVVFRRVDRRTGETRYIYHGNDGTSYPWNDTAQLNYLNPAVREGVIQTILHVARQFPIIRFDAAMTLAKRHYQRLWFPEPGMGGAIPSRAEHAMSKAAFDAAFPAEFWREVVDRVADELPDTLLLAEAFWMMEGYFVRTLGMHRVYNSAFMNMLRDEENANYRSVIKNTLKFDPEVLKRYVNFLNNPDERTAVDQFGKDDKYFGVCTLMATLPGLPMFGHGQIEGFAEKYGMEYRRAYQDERPDGWLMARHEREIFPLLHRRSLFAEVSNFLLYDFYTDAGRVNEDVYAYSNRSGAEIALVIYNNRFAEAKGWIRWSCAYTAKTSSGEKFLQQRTLGEALGLGNDPLVWVSFRDTCTNLEYLHRGHVLFDEGLRLELKAYKCHVFLDWRHFRDEGRRPWGLLCERLAGNGVPSLEDALRALELQRVHEALQDLVHPEIAESLAQCSANPEAPDCDDRVRRVVSTATERFCALIRETKDFALRAQDPGAKAGQLPGWHGDLEQAALNFSDRLNAALRLPELEKFFSIAWQPEVLAVLPHASTKQDESARIWGSILAWCALEGLGSFQDPRNSDAASTRLFDDLRMRESLERCFEKLRIEEEQRWKAASCLRASFAHAPWAPGVKPLPDSTRALFSWLQDPDIAWVIGVHAYEGVDYFVKEPFERLLWWMSLRTLLEIVSAPHPEIAVQALESEIQMRLQAAEDAGYQIEALFEQTHLGIGPDPDFRPPS